MGSEMCIRDRDRPLPVLLDAGPAVHQSAGLARYTERLATHILRDFADSVALTLFYNCLLYTSDAADERSSVDLGGRRIIKKKKKITSGRGRRINTNENKTPRVEKTNREYAKKSSSQNIYEKKT